VDETKLKNLIRRVEKLEKDTELIEHKIIRTRFQCEIRGLLIEMRQFISPVAEITINEAKKLSYVYCTNNINKCPICEAELVCRKGKFGHFLGCSAFPNCSGMRNKFGKIVFNKELCTYLMERKQEEENQKRYGRFANLDV